MAPIIGIIVDHVHKGSFSNYPHYALRLDYIHAIKQAGGIPFLMHYDMSLVEHYVEHIDGLLIPGGDYALDPSWYEDGQSSPFEESPRLAFEKSCVEKALAKNMPILGICAGMQVIAGMNGCVFTGDIRTSFDNPLEHLAKDPTVTAHSINIEQDTILHRLTQAKAMEVNSSHKEAVLRVSDRVHVSAKAPDGVIEAIECPDYRFVLGVQWHPELIMDMPHQSQLFKALVDAASS